MIKEVGNQMLERTQKSLFLLKIMLQQYAGKAYNMFHILWNKLH